MLFLGLSAGVPILLIFSTLSVWLREAGVDRSAVTFFSWAALGYSFKFLWAPLVDILPLPFFTKFLGRRRSWLLLSQFSVISAIILIGTIDPVGSHQKLVYMAIAAVLLGFSSATQDIIIDAYRIECAGEEMQALLASMYIAGYRVGMLIAGAGSLVIAGYLGTKVGAYDHSAWKITYYIMAAVMIIGVITTCVIKEPTITKNSSRYNYSASQYCRLLILFLLVILIFAVTFFSSRLIFEFVTNYYQVGKAYSGALGIFFVELLRFTLAVCVATCAAYCLSLSGFVNREMVNHSYIAPVRDFFGRYGAEVSLLFLALIGCYRLSDIVLGVVSNVFYVDMGFSKMSIASITKSFGLGMTLVGGFLGGLLTLRFGVIRILFLGGLLSALTNLLFMILAQNPGDIKLLTFVIGADNLSAGIATTAFVAFLSSLTSVSFTAVQYAIFSSLMTLLPKLAGGYSGTMVSSIGYEKFFLVTTVIGLPVLLLVGLVEKKMNVRETPS
ncbi:MAG: AmpG family muropeptide MFS transporter [Bacteroidetes bacterium]|nr:AmpG family muropeptide MFS transporter [Bacteroidota bacterium]